MKFPGLATRAAAALALSAVALWAAPIPPPQTHFGHPMGADRILLDWDKVVSYFQALGAASDRIRLLELGKSTEGRPFIAALIAAPQTLRDLDRYRAIQEKLADPRRTTDAEAEKLIAQGKTVVMITCSIHSTEVASTHTAVEFAYRLLTGDKPHFRAILDNTIFILVPSLNPDGVDIVTRWYRKTLGTPFEGKNPPELYQKYVGHDNNRDWYILSQVETQLTVAKLHSVWHPQIVYDVHQQGSFASRIFVPPWLDPVDPNIDPILAQECNQIGAGMAADLTAAGKTGVVINALYDFWSPARHYQAYHGGLRILSESASARLATPIHVRPNQIDRAGLGYNPRERSWNYLEPWMGGDWRLRDIVDYQLIALESCLYQAAVRREELLRAFYAVGKRAIGRKSPFAFVIPAVQRDPGSTRKMLETLSYGQVEVEAAAEPFLKYPAGTYLIRMQQPYSSYAKTLLERQQYPDLRTYPGGPPKRPYDVTAQTLPLLMGVEVDTVERPFRVRSEKVAAFPVDGHNAGLRASDISSWREVNRVWKSGGQIWRDPASGDFFTRSTPPAKQLPKPRIGLYKSYVPDMDEGWTRWLLEQFGFEYASVRNPDILNGTLHSRFDVVVFPDQPPPQIESGYEPESMPAEFTGGLGQRGAEALQKFVAAGGRLVFLNHSSEYAVRTFHLAVNNSVATAAPTDFYSPGSLLNVTLDSSHPLARGLPAGIAIWSEGSPAWDASAGAVAKYPASKVLASGWLLGENYLAGRAALLDLPVGTGRVILFGMRPQYRAQSYQTFKLFFNSLVE